jgi:hypothetical protein
MMTSFTLVFALVVGVVAVRVFNPCDTEITLDTAYLSLIETPVVHDQETVAVAAPEMTFEDIKIPVEKKPIITHKITPKKVIVVEKPVEVKTIEVGHNELPFHEPVKLAPVQFEGELLSNMVALYEGLPVEEKVLVAETKVAPVKDEVKTSQAAAVEVEPEFFEYKTEENAAPEPAVEVAATQAPVKEEVVENIRINVMDIQAPVDTIAVVPPQTTGPDVNVVGFDYSAMKKDIQTNHVPKVSAVTTHQKMKAISPKSMTPQTEKSAWIAPKYHSQMTIQGVATDLKTNETLHGFEVRFQDNSSEVIEDYGDGEVTITQALAHPRMTRSLVLLKRGFAPTNTDLILQEGAESVSLPVIPEERMSELTVPFESNGVIGAVLVELADETDKAMLDVPFGKVMTLDGDMRETTSEDFRYQLFLGVKAGNALLTYVHGNEVTNKIIHIHEHELTYEANFFEKNNLSRVSLWQEDLLSREKAPLITASENVKVFVKNNHGEKLNQNTYKINFGKVLLGGRNYLELSHEAEPVFIGTRSEMNLVIPSENFMRHILGSLPEGQLGNRCLIQVNMKNKVSDVSVGAESVDQGLMVNTQFLDADGRFYDSASEKTRKVIVFGENQGSETQELSGKVNLKITYLDGSVDYLGTYCSPNSYLVEQL